MTAARKRKPRDLLATAVAAALALAAGSARAVVLPQGPIVAGSTGGPGATFTYGAPGVLTVNQSASRVVIDWTSFSIGAGGVVSFSQASPNWIAFNRVNINPATGLSPLSTISGALNARGGVWLFSTGGILFGSGAVVNVGSFAGITGPLGASGGLGQLLNSGPGGLTSVTIDPPAASGLESIVVQSGARITAASGYVVLQSETMTQSGAITAFDGVDYTVAESGQIVFATTPAGQQLQSAGASVAPGQDRPSFTLGGVTKGAWVGIDTPGGALQTGYHGLINLDGQIEATGVKPGSDDGVVLLIGGDAGPAYPGYTNSSVGLDAAGATITATGGLAISTDSATLGSIAVGGPLSVRTYGRVNLTAPVSSGGSALLSSAAGDVNLDANLIAAGAVTAEGQSIVVGSNATIRSDSAGAGAGGIVLSSAGDVTASASSRLVAGSAASAPSDAVTVRAGSGGGGGNIVLGAVSGTQVFVQGLSQGVAGEGAVTLAGPVEGSQGVTVLVNSVAAAGAPAGGLQVLGSVSSAGFVDLEDLGPATVTIGPGAAVRSTGGQVFLYSGGDTTVADGASVAGVSLLDHTLGTLTVESGASLSTTGASPAPIAPVIPYGADFQRASGLNLAASAMNIQGAVTAGGAARSDDLYIEVLGAPGATAVIGGSGGGAGFDLPNAGFANLSARNIVIMAGPGEAAGPGASLVVEDLSLDPAKLSSLWLGAASSQSITVAGGLSVTGPGSVDLQLGFARLGFGGSYQGGAVTNPGSKGLDGFVPGSIAITGSLGTAASPLSVVNLVARDDILIGSPAFVAAAGADPTLNAVTASASYPLAGPGHVFVAAGSLQLAAQGRIVAQNNPGAGFLFAGLDIGAPTAATPLIFAPPALAGQPIGGGAWTAAFGLGPSSIDLFGLLSTAGGTVVADAGAARQPYLLNSAITGAGLYRINGCAFGAACQTATSSLTFEVPPVIDTAGAPPAGAPQGASAGGQAVAGGSASTNVASDLTATAIGLQDDDSRLGSTNPVTETGNGDLWSGGADPCPPKPTPGQDCRKP